MTDEELKAEIKAAQKELIIDENEPKSALQKYQEMGYTNKVADYNDGQIIENPQTLERVFVSPGYITSDTGVIQGILDGISPAETTEAIMQDEFIAENPITARGATILQGVPFVGPYTDEAMDFMFDGSGEAARYGIKAMQDRKPVESTALEIGGAVASLPALIAATPAAVTNYIAGGASLLKKMGRAALSGTFFGTVEGGVSGYGREEGEKRLEGAGTGAGIGALTGGVTAAAFPAASSVIRAAWTNIKGRSVKEIANTLGISTDAAKVIRIALENDDLETAQIALERAGSSSMLADAGPSAKGLLDVSVTSGGTSPRFVRNVVEERAEKAGGDINTVLDNLLGKPMGLKTTQKGIRIETAADRNSVYKSAYSKPIDYSNPGGKNIQSLLRRLPSSVVKTANDLMKIEGNESFQILAEIAENGNVVFTRLPDVRQLDYITRALNQISDQQNALGKLGGTTPIGRATGGLSKLIRNVLKKEIPEYKIALDTASDAIERMKAVDTGYSILNNATTREEVRDSVSNLSKVQLTEARQGLRSAIDDALAKVNAVASDSNIEIREFQKLANNLRSRASREKMEILLGKKNASNLYKKLDEAVVTLELRAAISRNSATQQRTVINQKTDEITSPSFLDILMSGEPLNASRRLAQVISGNTPEAKTLRKMGIYDEIAGVLVSLRGKDAQNALKLVRRAMNGEALSEQQAQTISKVLSTSAAISLYSIGTSEISGEVVPLINGDESNSTIEVETESDDTIEQIKKALENLTENITPSAKEKILDAANVN